MRQATMRPVFATHCLGCQKRIHAPSEESFLKQKFRHMRNCGALKLRGQVVPLESLPAPVVAKMAVLRRPRTVWERFLILVHAILAALRWRR